MITRCDDQWDNQFLKKHQIFWPLIPLAQAFVESHTNWPGLTDYQQFFEAGTGKRLSAGGAQLEFVEQDHKSDTFENGYEPRIFLKGEIQTRQHNWHDFFQVLIWRAMPKSKTIINQLHFQALKHRQEKLSMSQTRGPIENALTQFDECGAVILSSDPQLLKLIEDFKWKTLFWQNRDEVLRNLRCIVFGHALYEKALQPYIGMTAHSVLISVDAEFLNQPPGRLVTETDDLLTHFFQDNSAIQSPQDFSPFPLLGMPNWHPANSKESFYENKNYFRPGRRRNN